MAVPTTLAIALTTLMYSAPDPGPEAKVEALFDQWCTSCHSGGGNPASDPANLDLDVPLESLVGVPSAANGQPLIVPGDPDASYLVLKMRGGKGMEGEIMPLGEDPLLPAQVKVVAEWIEGLPAASAPPPPPPPPAPSAEVDPAVVAKVEEIFDESCTSCHSGGGNPASDPSAVDLDVPLHTLVGVPSAANGKPLVVPGDPDASYLLLKMKGGEGMDGEIMPMGDDPLSPEKLQAVSDWIASLPPPGSGADGGGGGDGDAVPEAPKPRGRKPFNGTTQIVLPTTTTLGKRTLQYRIDHRFGRIGTERGAFGMDGGVSMAMGLQYGILDGWDVQLRRANSRKTWELGTKYIPLRQEDGRVLSLGGYAALSYLRDFDVANPWVGDFQVMLSRLWFDRWSTMLVLGYHLNTNHNARVTVDFDDGAGPVPVRDRRDTLTMGIASTVWVDKKKRWGIDMEYVLPIPDGGTPNAFYYRGGDADPDGTRIGAWSLGGSLRTAKHFFQVFFTNNREIATNLYASGGQSGNPFGADVDSKNPFHKANFFLGFNLGRQFNIKAPKGKKKARANKSAGEGTNE